MTKASMGSVDMGAVDEDVASTRAVLSCWRLTSTSLF